MTRQHRPMTQDAMKLVARRFRALADPTRLAILDALADGESTVTALAQRIGTTQPNVSKHLATLEESGLVEREPRGTSVVCRIADVSVFDVCESVCAGIERRLEAQAKVLRLRRRTGDR